MSINTTLYDDQYKRAVNHQQVDLMMAQNFLDAIDDSGKFCFQTFDDDKDQGRKHLVRQFHGSLAEYSQELIALQKQGAGVFFTVNETDGKGRCSKNIVRVRSVFVDLDGAPLDPVLGGPLEPHIVVETSPGRYHAYWLIDNLPLERFTDVQTELLKRFSGDEKVKDLPRVMRLPGLLHLKGAPLPVKVITSSGTIPYDAEEFYNAFEIHFEPGQLHHIISSENDPILAKLRENKMLIKENASKLGAHHIYCPWRNSHTRKDIQTFYYQPGAVENPHPSFKCFHDHCLAKNIHDLKLYLGLNEEKNVVFDEDPIPLIDELTPVMKLTSDMIPSPLKEWVVDISERMQVPLEFPAVSALSVLSSLLGRKAGILPKKHDDWLVVSNVWGAIIARPSLFKSPVINESKKPLEPLKKIAQERFDDEMKDYEFECLIQKKCKKSIGDDIEKQFKNKKDFRRDPLKMEELKEEFRNSEELEHPSKIRFETQDTTVEKLGELLRDNPNGILVIRDELMGWFKNLEKQGHESARAFYLEAWSGVSSGFTYDRIDRGEIEIPNPCVTVFGGIQPGPFMVYLNKAKNNLADDDGLLQRFQLLVWPDEEKEWENVDRVPNQEAKEKVFRLYQFFAEFKPEFDNSLSSSIPAVRFDEKAQALFDSWRCTLERRLRSGELEPEIEAHLGKYRSLMPSLALLFQLILDYSESISTFDVKSQATELAIRWCTLLESHAIRVYSSDRLYRVTVAKAILNKIKEGVISVPFTARDIYRKGWSHLSDSEKVGDGLKELEAKGWLKSRVRKTGGASSTVWYAHPIVTDKTDRTA